MFSGSVEDRTLIRELMSTYAGAVFRGDLEAWLATYSEEGVWLLQGAEHRGKPALRAHFERLFAPIEKMAFFTEVSAIEVQADQATAHSYCREILVMKNGDVRKVVGHYRDQLVRREGAWLFARRAYELFLSEQPIKQHSPGEP
jgi:uncharacterized protein (TIGR02246 family)